jgi:hypothetical protein
MRSSYATLSQQFTTAPGACRHEARSVELIADTAFIAEGFRKDGGDI